ncbi:MAG: sensor histidine kinase [Myxococcales bacterium]
MDATADHLFPEDIDAEVDRVKHEFVAMLSHELGTPLAAMRLWLDALQEEVGPTKPVLALRECVGEQTRLVNDLLDMTRVMTGKLRVALESIDPARCARDAVEALKATAESKGVSVESSLHHAPRIRADPVRLRQIMGKLLSNAVKFTPNGGHVEVKLENSEGGVEFAVRDDGRGFSPEFKRFLFTPFRQEENGETRASEGLGLGLAIVERLVELHRGTVKGDSEGPGRGATFTVWLPAAANP